MTSATLAGVVVAVGFLLVLDNLAGIDVAAAVILGAVIAILGAGLLVSGFVGRAAPLIPLSLLALLLLPVAPLLDTTLAGGIGERKLSVSTPEALDDQYTRGLGVLELDLTDLELGAGREEAIEVDVGAGHATIRVPRDLQVDVEARSRAGYVKVFGFTDQGVFNEIHQISDQLSDLSAGGEDQGRLYIVADVTFGYVEVVRG